MVVGPQEGVQALWALAHVGVGLTSRIIPLVVLARAWEGGQGRVDIRHGRRPWHTRGSLLRRMERERGGAGKRGTHQHHRAEHIRPDQGTPGRHWRAKVVPHNARHAAVAQRRDQPQYIPDQVEHTKSLEVTVIRAVPACGAPVASLVGRNDVQPGRSEGQQHLAPTIGQFWEAVQQEDTGATLVLKAGLQQVHGETMVVGHEAGAYARREGNRVESHGLPLLQWRRLPGRPLPLLYYAKYQDTYCSTPSPQDGGKVGMGGGGRRVLAFVPRLHPHPSPPP